MWGGRSLGQGAEVLFCHLAVGPSSDCVCEGPSLRALGNESVTPCFRFSWGDCCLDPSCHAGQWRPAGKFFGSVMGGREEGSFQFIS